MLRYPEIMKRLKTIFQEVFDDDDLEIGDTTNANDVDEWDSLSHITLVLAVEQAFNLKLRASEVGELQNVGEMARLIEDRLAA